MSVRVANQVQAVAGIAVEEVGVVVVEEVAVEAEEMGQAAQAVEVVSGPEASPSSNLADRPLDWSSRNLCRDRMCIFIAIFGHFVN